MKNRCYPHYSYWIFMILGIFMLVFSIFLFCNITSDSLFIVVVGSILTLLSVICFTGGLINMQWYEISNNAITVRTIFGELIKMDFTNIVYEVVYLDTFFSRGLSIKKVKWMCFYDKNESFIRFIYGCTNKRNKHRLQVVYSESLMKKVQNANLEKLLDLNAFIK